MPSWVGQPHMIDPEIVPFISHHSRTVVVYHFFLGLPNYRFPRLIATKIMHAFLPSRVCASPSEAFGLNSFTLNTKWALSFILRITWYVDVRGLTHRIHGTRSGPSGRTNIGSVSPKSPPILSTKSSLPPPSLWTLLIPLDLVYVLPPCLF